MYAPYLKTERVRSAASTPASELSQLSAKVKMCICSVRYKMVECRDCGTAISCVPLHTILQMKLVWRSGQIWLRRP